MNADRDMDARIAERCFGWQRHGQPADYDGAHRGEPVLLPPGVTWEAQLAGGFQLPPSGKIHLAFFVPPYTSGWNGALRLLDDIHEEWVFSKRHRFYEALADLCIIDARPAFHPVSADAAKLLQSSRVAWPYALGHFRREMPEFICRAALDVADADEKERSSLSERAPASEGQR